MSLDLPARHYTLRARMPLTASYRMADAPTPEFDALLRQHFPEGFTGKQTRSAQAEPLVLDFGPLGPEHVEVVEAHLASGGVLGVTPTLGPIRNIRHTHHRLAQLLSMGMNETRAAMLCSYSPNYVSVIKNDPAFAELLAHYSGIVKEEYVDFVSAAKDLSLDMMGRLREFLEHEPERLTPSMVLESLKVLADRSGNAPTTKTLNMNVNVDVGSKLDAARARLRNVTPVLAHAPPDES